MTAVMEPLRRRRGIYVGMLGDVVASRDRLDRARLQQEIDDALRATQELVPGAREPSATVGDEFQGLYWTVADAINASLIIRLHLVGRADVRFGIGWGPLTYFGARGEQHHQDGPAWWAARDAIERAHRSERTRGEPSNRRVLFSRTRSAGAPRRAIPSHLTDQMQLPGFEDELPAASEYAEEDSDLMADGFVNSVLLCSDELLARLDERDARLTLDLIVGRSMEESVQREGISRSAISQRRRRNGGYALRDVYRELKGPTP